MEPALAFILEGIKEPAERERVLAAYHTIAGGDPNSFPTAFALVSTASLRSHLALMDRERLQLQNQREESFKSLDGLISELAGLLDDFEESKKAVPPVPAVPLPSPQPTEEAIKQSPAQWYWGVGLMGSLGAIAFSLHSVTLYLVSVPILLILPLAKPWLERQIVRLKDHL